MPVSPADSLTPPRQKQCLAAPAQRGNSHTSLLVRARACAAAAGSEFFGCTRAHCSRQAHFNSLRALGISESVNVDLTVLTEPNGKEAEGRKEGCQASWVLRDRVLELSPADIRGTLSLKTGDHHLTSSRTMTSPRSCGTGPPSRGLGTPAWQSHRDGAAPRGVQTAKRQLKGIVLET